MIDVRSHLANLSEEKRRLLACRLERALSASETSGLDPDAAEPRGHPDAGEPRGHPDASAPSGHSSPTNGRAMFVAFVEASSPGNTDLSAQLRADLSARLPEYMIPAAFVVVDRLPRTASGKIDRASLGRLPRTTDRAPDSTLLRSDAEAGLTRIWTEVLGVDSIGLHENFFELGGDSILSIRVIARAREAGLRISPKQFHDSPTIAALAVFADGARRPETEPAIPETGSSHDVPLTPIQHWFFEYVNEDPHHWNQAMLLEIPAQIGSAAVRDALTNSMAGFEAFRLQFARGRSSKPEEPRTSMSGAEAGSPEWRQTLLSGNLTVPFDVIDHSGQPADVRAAALEEVEARLHASFDLAKAPLVRAAFFVGGATEPARLLLVIHHLIIDGISWALLLEELEHRLAGGSSNRIEEEVTFSQWARHLRSGIDLVRDEREFWLQRPRPASPIPTDLSGDQSSNLRGDADTVALQLDPGNTQSLLRGVPEAYRTQVNDVLLCALVTAFSQWSGSPSLRISLEGHGRHPPAGELDPSRSIGWFTTVYPVELEIDIASNIGERLKSVKEQLRRIPRHGTGHGMLRHLSSDDSVRAALRKQPDPDVMFNYLGQRFVNATALRRIRDAGPGARSPRARRPCWIEIDSFIEEGSFHARWTYGTRIHHRATIQSLAERFNAALIAIVRHCEEGHSGATPSDFPLAGLGQAELDRIAGLLGPDGA